MKNLSKQQIIEKAWKTLMSRLHARSKPGDGSEDRFWHRPQPAFRWDSKNCSFYLDLVYGSNITYKVGINSGPQGERPVNVAVNEKLPLSTLCRHVATMRQCKDLPNIEFKRIWLETAVGHTLYQLSPGSYDLDPIEPFITELDSIESLAVQYDLTHIGH